MINWKIEAVTCGFVLETLVWRECSFPVVLGCDIEGACVDWGDTYCVLLPVAQVEVGVSVARNVRYGVLGIDIVLCAGVSLVLARIDRLMMRNVFVIGRLGV